MAHARFTLDEFKTLFPGPFESEEQMLREYRSFLMIVEQADKTPVPELSAWERAEIFRRSWGRPVEPRPSVWASLAFWRRPALTFAFGLVLGCVLMFGCMRARAQAPQSPEVEQTLVVEQAGSVQTYGGKALQGLYPQIENPRMVVEKQEDASEPKRVLYGTLDDGEVYVVWNL